MSRRKEEFKLLSGVRCVVQEFTGAFEEDFTSENAQKQKSALDNMLLDCILELGTKTKSEISIKDIRNMPSGDRQFALICIRQLSNDFDPNFVFKFEFPVINGEKQKYEYKVNFSVSEIHIEESGIDKKSTKEESDSAPLLPSEKISLKSSTVYPEKQEGELKQYLDSKNIGPENLTSPSANFEAKRYKQQVEDYRQFDHERDIQLPCGEKLRIEILTGNLESDYSQRIEHNRKNNRSNLSSHDMIYMRNPRIVREKDGKEQLIKPTLSTFVHRDLEFIRKNILEEEGKIDTLIVIQNPVHPEYKERVDLLLQPAFYFPSLGV